MAKLARYETTFTLTVSVRAESEEDAEHHFTRAQIQLLEARTTKPVTIRYLEPNDLIDCMEAGT